jgi:hypothetical protein
MDLRSAATKRRKTLVECGSGGDENNKNFRNAEKTTAFKHQ